MSRDRSHAPHAVGAHEAWREAFRQGLLEAMDQPRIGQVKCMDWYFHHELPEYMFVPGGIPDARRVSRFKDNWRDELPFVWRKDSGGLPNPLDCYFVDPSVWDGFVIVTQPWVAHDYEIGTCTRLTRKYPSSLFLKRVSDFPTGVDEDDGCGMANTIYLPPETVRTLKLVAENDFIEGVV